MKQFLYCALLILVFASCASVPPLVEEDVTITDIVDGDLTPDGQENVSAEINVENTEDIEALSESELVPESFESPSHPDLTALLYFYPEPETLVITDSSKALPTDSLSNLVPELQPTLVPVPPQKAIIKKTEPPTQKKTELEKKSEKPVQKQEQEVVPSAVVPPVPEIHAAEREVPTLSSSSTNFTFPPSRKVSLTSGQILEVWYPGSGWVFLGDSSSRNGLSYLQRKLDGLDTLFSFRAQKPGSYILEFSRFDLLSDSYLLDSLAVDVLETPTQKTGTIRAPAYRKDSIVPVDSTNLNRSTSAVMADEPSLRALPPTESDTGTILNKDLAKAETPSSLLEQGRTALSLGNVKETLAILDKFFSLSTELLDEGWYLRGQSYEANSPVRNILKSIDSYETLTRAYPSSAHWKDADARIRYLRQFYLQIR